MRFFSDFDQAEAIMTPILERLALIKNPVVRTLISKPEVKVDIPDDSKKVHINWSNPKNGYEREILLYMADRVAEDGLLVGKPRFVSSYVEVDRMMPSPLEGLTAMLTTIATLNQAAIEVGGFHHVEVANHNASPVFEVLRKSGLYGYADHNGNRVSEPVETPHGIIYSSNLPIPRLDSLLSRFVIPDGARQLSDLIVENRE